MKVNIPKEKEIPNIEYLGKEYKVTPMKIGEFRLFSNIKEGENFDVNGMVDFISARLPEMKKEDVESIPVHHLEPIITAIKDVYEISNKEKKSSSE